MNVTITKKLTQVINYYDVNVTIDDVTYKVHIDHVTYAGFPDTYNCTVDTSIKLKPDLKLRITDMALKYVKANP